MEQALKEVSAYHGILEVVETNGQGKSITQSKREVWADKDGNYYLKEIEGFSAGQVTVNNGQKKWQLRPSEKTVYIFTAFPDPYRFTFELGKEINDVKNALSVKVIGEEEISGRQTEVLEVTPEGGAPYRLWIDKETDLPLQRQSAMQNASRYKVTYTQIDFMDTIPAELQSFTIPKDYKVIDSNPSNLSIRLKKQKVAMDLLRRYLRIFRRGIY